MAEQNGKLPWMKFNPQKFMGDDRVGRMNATERGIYISLLCDAWQGEPGIPDDPESLAFRCGATPDQMQEAWPKIRPCFDEHPNRDGWLIQARMEKERREALELKRKRSEAGKKGARAKHGKANGDASGDGGGGASGSASGGATNNRASDNVNSQDVGSTPSEEGEEPEKGEKPETWMHEVWHEELGIEGHRIKLTDKRRSKYRAMYEEQLADTEDPRRAWRMVLRRVQVSDHHMSERSYQMPESLLRNPERRETWVQRTLEAARRGTTSPDERKRSAKKERIRAAIDDLEAAS